MDRISSPAQVERPTPVSRPEAPASEPPRPEGTAPSGDRATIAAPEPPQGSQAAALVQGLAQNFALGGVTPPPPRQASIPSGVAAERLVNTAPPQRVGDFSRMAGLSSRELISRLPPEARLEPFYPSQSIQNGMKARWTDARGTQHFFEIHGPDRGPNAGPNASQGNITRYQQTPAPPEGLSGRQRRNFQREQGRYMTGDGRLVSHANPPGQPGHVSPNETHVPVQGNPNTPEYQRARQLSRVAGRGLMVVGAAQSVHNIATAQDRARAVAQEGAAWTGASLLARGGAFLCSPGGPLASAACGLLGGAVGFGGAHLLGGYLYDRASRTGAQP